MLPPASTLVIPGLTPVQAGGRFRNPSALRPWIPVLGCNFRQFSAGMMSELSPFFILRCGRMSWRLMWKMTNSQN